jgi:nascent polypeptide-associated complex subunit alpha
MMPKMDSKQMAKIMQQMGIRTEEIDAERVVIEKTAASGGGRLVVENPSVTLIDAKGQKSFQVSGAVREEEGKSSSEKEAASTSGEEKGLEEREEDDASVVASQAGVSKEEAQAALDAAGGDIAEAIVSLEAKKKR